MAKIIEMPKLGFDMAEGTLIHWVKGEGEKIEKGETLAEIETDKATVQVDSSASGVLFKQLVPANTTLPIGTPIAVITEEGETVNLDELLGSQAKEEKGAVTPKPENAQPAAAKTEVEETMAKAETGFIKASPVARSMAKENSIDLAALEGSGPGGRIVKRDVEKAMQAPTPSKMATPKPVITSGQDQHIPLSRLRSAIGRRMQESKQNIPHFTITHSYDVAGLMKMRAQMNEELDQEQKLSINDFIIRATALALKQFPNLNASLAENEILQHGDIHIGVAVSLENGLLTVVVKNADRKSLPQIARESRELAQRAREGKLRNEDVEGSTFTISNLGMFDVEDFTAIINPPEAAILAIGSAQEVPVVENSSVKTGWRMKATLSADHRVTDGVEAARFMQHLALYLEQPWRLI